MGLIHSGLGYSTPYGDVGYEILVGLTPVGIHWLVASLIPILFDLGWRLGYDACGL